jgi:hypothetical protein
LRAIAGRKFINDWTCRRECSNGFEIDFADSGDNSRRVFRPLLNSEMAESCGDQASLLKDHYAVHNGNVTASPLA